MKNYRIFIGGANYCNISYTDFAKLAAKHIHCKNATLCCSASEGCEVYVLKYAYEHGYGVDILYDSCDSENYRNEVKECDYILSFSSATGNEWKKLREISLSCEKTIAQEAIPEGRSKFSYTFDIVKLFNQILDRIAPENLRLIPVPRRTKYETAGDKNYQQLSFELGA